MATLIQTRKPTATRQREIAEATLRVIGEQGAAALTAARIAAEVGITAGALFRHFASIEAILDAAVDCALEKLAGTFPDADHPPVHRLRQLTERRLALLRSEPGLAWLLLSDQARLQISESSLEKLQAMVTRSREFLLGALREGADSGALRSDLPPQHLLVILTGTLHAAAGTRGVHRRNTSDTAVLDSVFTLISGEPS